MSACGRACVGVRVCGFPFSVLSALCLLFLLFLSGLFVCKKKKLCLKKDLVCLAFSARCQRAIRRAVSAQAGALSARRSCAC